MAETEVETILREIRERVLAQQSSGRDLTTNGGNGAGSEPGSAGILPASSSRDPIAAAEDAGRMPALPGSLPETLAAGNLSLINSYLTTTARAWDRLPPVVSNRSGFVARVELWLKRHLKRATRWYSWEQINFNAAIHHALRDMLPILAAYEAELRKLRAQLADTEAREAARAKEFADALAAQAAAQANDLQAQSQAQSRANELRNNHVDAQLAGLVAELRERVEHLQDEQRVCYKQLQLETTEAAVLEDRARRKTEILLEELTRRVEQLEK